MTTAKVAKVANQALGVAKWLWRIPGIKLMIGTRLAQAGIVGVIALSIADKALGV